MKYESNNTLVEKLLNSVMGTLVICVVGWQLNEIYATFIFYLNYKPMGK